MDIPELVQTLLYTGWLNWSKECLVTVIFQKSVAIPPCDGFVEVLKAGVAQLVTDSGGGESAYVASEPLQKYPLPP